MDLTATLAAHAAGDALGATSEFAPLAGIPEIYRQFTAADFDPDSFRPLGPLAGPGRDGYCLTTLQIAVWAMHWARRGEHYLAERLPAGFPREPFQRTGGDVLGWVALIGRDADTYGATAEPLVAAVAGLPRSMTAGLEVLRELPAMPSPPVEEQGGLLRSRRPEDVAVAVGESHVVVAYGATEWAGPHLPRCLPEPVAMHEHAGVADVAWLRRHIARAAASNLNRRIRCPNCGGLFPLEHMGLLSCHGCDEEKLHIVH